MNLWILHPDKLIASVDPANSLHIHTLCNVVLQQLTPRDGVFFSIFWIGIELVTCFDQQNAW